MESETVRLLRQRQSELAAQECALQAQLAPLRAERDQVEIAIRALTGKILLPSGHDASMAAVAHHRRKANPAIQTFTFKQLVVKALRDHFPEGATANQLLEFFRREWGREIMRTSLSPQLSRLKDDNLIEREGKTWHLSKPAKAFGTPGLFPEEIGAAQGPPLNPPRESAEPAQPKLEDHPSH